MDKDFIEWKYCGFCGGEMHWVDGNYIDRETGMREKDKFWRCKNWGRFVWKYFMPIHDEKEMYDFREPIPNLSQEKTKPVEVE